MTALPEYARLEATALWRAAPDDQRREVVVSIGDATLTISDFQNRSLAHWSLAAVARANPGKVPAIFHPDGDLGETLEIGADGQEMIDAIERVRRAVERRRPRPGRLRLVIGLAIAAMVGAVAFFWLPGALLDHTVRIVPAVKRVEIGEALMSRVTRVAGRPCRDPTADPALAQLGQRLLGAPGRDALRVMRAGVREATHLPGGLILLNRSLVEDHEAPDVVAGFVLTEDVARRTTDPLHRMLSAAGPMATLRLLTTGLLPEDVLDAYAETLLTTDPARPGADAVLARFAEAKVSSSPFAYAVDITGETTLALIEADPFLGAPSDRPVLDDGDWVRLQGICGG